MEVIANLCLEAFPENLRSRRSVMKENSAKKMPQCGASLHGTGFFQALHPFTIILEETQCNTCCLKCVMNSPNHSSKVLERLGTTDNSEQNVEVKALSILG
jgi:hypothetical protein